MAETRTARVEAVRQLTPDVRELVLHLDGVDPVAFVPGQWLSLHLPVGEHPPLIRAYSLAAPPQEGGRLTLCFDRVEDGLGTGYLWSLGVGNSITWAGPLGNFALPDGDGDLLLAARYTGIVPFNAMSEQITEASGQGRRIALVYGAPTENERVYADALNALAERLPLFHYLPVADGDEEAALTLLPSDFAPQNALVCGVRDFTAPLRAAIMERYALDRRAVKVENYTGPSR